VWRFTVLGFSVVCGYFAVLKSMLKTSVSTSENGDVSQRGFLVFCVLHYQIPLHANERCLTINSAGI